MRFIKRSKTDIPPPDSVDEKLYQEIKASPESYPPELVGFVGVGCSFGGKWFGGYARSQSGAEENPGKYAGQSKRNILSQDLWPVEFYSCSYEEVPIPITPCIIYCDPPYRGTTEYKERMFDHNKFWAWCDTMTLFGHMVFVSEYTAPTPWIPIWEKTIGSFLGRNVQKASDKKMATEKLFVHLDSYLDGLL